MRTSLTLLLVMMTATSFAQLTALDSSFANNGILRVDTPAMFGNGTYLALQTDGKIVVAGTYNYNTPSIIPNGIALMRFHANGTIDTTLNHNGLVKTPTNDYVTVSGLAVQPDNKITVLASTSFYQGHTTLIARYQENGAFDPGFNDSGKIMYDNQNTFNSYSAMAQQPDGKILITGKGDVNSLGLNRYTTDGRPDSSFGFYGIVSTPLTGSIYSTGRDIALLPDGRMIVGGNARQSGIAQKDQFIVSRFSHDGLLDPAFHNGDGFCAFVFPGQYSSSFSSVAVKSDGKILACGFVTYRYEGAAYYELLQLDSNGVPDNSFGNNGVMVIDSIKYLYAITYPTADVTVQNDGKILVSMGVTGANGNPIFALYRLLDNGSRDVTFGLNGQVTTQISANHDLTHNMVIQTDGKILVSGLCNNYGPGGYPAMAVVRYKPNIKFNKVPDVPTDMSEVNLYPNPATNTATITFTLLKEGPVNVDLYDVYGRKIQEIMHSNRVDKGMQQYSFKLPASLASGHYFVRIKTDEKAVTSMLVKE